MKSNHHDARLHCAMIVNAALQRPFCFVVTPSIEHGATNVSLIRFLPWCQRTYALSPTGFEGLHCVIGVCHGQSVRTFGKRGRHGEFLPSLGVHLIFLARIQHARHVGESSDLCLALASSPLAREASVDHWDLHSGSVQGRPVLVVWVSFVLPFPNA